MAAQLFKNKCQQQRCALFHLSTVWAGGTGLAGLDRSLLDLDGGDTTQVLKVQRLEQVLLYQKEYEIESIRICTGVLLCTCELSL